MSLHIPSDTTLQVQSNPDGSLILHFRKRPLETETTAIEATEVADADAATVADNDATTSTLKRHKGAVFDEKMTFAKSLVATQGNDARTTALERLFVARCEEKPGDDLIEAHRKYFFTVSSKRDSVLSIAQALDSSFPMIEMGKLAGLKMLNNRKLAVQAKKNATNAADGTTRYSRWTTNVHRVVRRREDRCPHRTHRRDGGALRGSVALQPAATSERGVPSHCP